MAAMLGWFSHARTCASRQVRQDLIRAEPTAGRQRRRLFERDYTDSLAGIAGSNSSLLSAGRLILMSPTMWWLTSSTA